MKFNLIPILTSILAFTQSTLAGEKAVPKECPTLDRDQITTLIKKSKDDITILQGRLKVCEKIIDRVNNGYDLAMDKCDLFNANGKKYRLLPLTEHNENFGRRHGIKARNSSENEYKGTACTCINEDAIQNNEECWTPPKRLLLKKITWRKDAFVKAIVKELLKDSPGKKLGRLILTMNEWQKDDQKSFNIFMKMKKFDSFKKRSFNDPELFKKLLNESNKDTIINLLKEEIEKNANLKDSSSSKDKVEPFLEELQKSWYEFCKNSDEKCSFNPIEFYNSQKTPLYCVYYHHPWGRKEPIITLMEEFDDSSFKRRGFNH